MVIKLGPEFIGSEDASAVLASLIDQVPEHPTRLPAKREELKTILGQQFQGRIFRTDLTETDWNKLQSKIELCLDNLNAQTELLPLIESLLQ